MPFNVGEFFNYLKDLILNSPFTKGIIRNPIYTGVALGVMIFLLVLFIFRGVETPDTEPLWKLSLRVCVYAIFLSVAMIFFHNAYLIHDSSTIEGGAQMKELFDNPIDSEANDDSKKLVKPDIKVD
jgi:hypothetical protein